MNEHSDEIGAGRGEAPGPGFFGRRKGKQLRQHQTELIQTLLPTVTVDLAKARLDPCRLFDRPVKEVRVEIGFGGGEHLVAAALRNPEIGFIGCEAFVNGVAKLLHAIEEQNISNIRIHPEDALELLRELPDASISRVYLLYPDPWPKPRQRKRRIVSDTFGESLSRILKDGAHFRFATDIDDYSAWTLSRLLRNPDFAWLAETATDWTSPWANWPGTRYEAKARREGRPPAYMTFERKPRLPGSAEPM